MTGRSSESLQWFNENNTDETNGTSTYLDLCFLDRNGNHSARTLIKHLLDGADFQHTINCSPNTDDQLYRLFVDNRNQFYKNGISNLSIGFPIIRLIGKNKHPNCLAPLFIWPVELLQTEKSQTWNLSRANDAGIKINFALHQYLLQQHKIDLLKLSHPIIDQKNLSAITLSKICYELSSALGSKEDLFIDQINPLPTNSSSQILCAAVIGSFSITQPQVSGTILEESLSIEHPFALKTLDPSQTNIFNEFWKNGLTQVLQEPGVGKSHLVETILINALSNGHRSIFFADSIQQIKKLRNALTTAGLDHLLLEITNPQKDAQKIRQALQFKSTTAKENFDEQNFRLLIHKCKRLHENLDLSFAQLDQPVFDKASWSKVIPYYLAANRKERQDLLDNQLNTIDFTFHPTEYISLKEAVQTSEKLYEPINDLKHPLQPLNAEVFLEHKKEVAKRKVEDLLQHFQEKFEELHHRYILKQQDYVRDLNQTFDLFFEDVSHRIEELKYFIEENQLLYGNDFEDSGILQKGKLKVYGVFSGKHKNILQARSSISEQYQDLRQLLLNNYPDAFNAPETIDQKASQKIIDLLHKLEDQLYDWLDTQKSSIAESLQRLNTKSVHPSLDYAEQISELEYSLHVNIEALNDAKLYQLPLQNRMLTIPMRQLFIQDILNQIQATKNHLSQFDTFYDWQRHWLLLPEVHRQLISAIIRIHPANWNQAFESWYFYQRLKSDFHFKMPKNEKSLIAFGESLEKLREQLPSQIRYLWRQQNKKAKSNPGLNKLSINDLIHSQFDQLSTQFPIIAMSPAAADQIQFSKKANIDLAIVYSTHHNQTYPFSAKKVLRFISSLPEDRRLLQKTFRLHYVHRPMHSEAFQFANHLIHRSKKQLVASLAKKDFFSVRDFNGPARHKVNPAEAEAIVQEVIKANNHPGIKNNITVVCLTVEQRDLIARKLFDHSKALSSSKTGAPNHSSLDKVNIYHLLEPMGCGEGTLFFSMTLEDFDTRESSMISSIHSNKGLSAIEKIISSAFDKVNIYHSLPSEKLERYTKHQTKKSIRLLTQWINFAISSENQAPQFPIIESDQKINAQKDFGSFSLEVAKMLKPYVGKSRIKLNANYKGINIPLLIEKSNDKGKDIAILTNYSLSNDIHQAHSWKLTQVKQLRSLGLEVFSVWSANWLEKPSMSARKLASAIIKLDRN